MLHVALDASDVQIRSRDGAVDLASFKGSMAKLVAGFCPQQNPFLFAFERLLACNMLQPIILDQHFQRGFAALMPVNVALPKKLASELEALF